MRDMTDERWRAVLERAAGARRKSRPPQRSHLLETCLGFCAVLFAFLSVVATYPDEANEILDRAAIAFLQRESSGDDMETTASIGRRAPSSPEQDLQGVSERGGQSDGAAGPRVHIDMGEETLRGGF